MAQETATLKKSDKEQGSEMFALPKNTSSIRNECNNICQDLTSFKQNIEERLNILDRNDEKMTALNYRMYQIRYDYSTKIRDLMNLKNQLETTDKETRSSFGKDVEECEHQYIIQHDATKKQMIEAQEEYEDTLGTLDTNLESMKKKLGNLLLLMEARKAEASDQDLLEDTMLVTQLGEYEQFIDYYTEIQTVGWSRRKTVQDPANVNGLRFTEQGLLATESGQELSYEAAVEQNLLQNMHPIFSIAKLVNTPEQEASSSESRSTRSSGRSKMSSEDVAYLKENLGTPLTLALAEISAVQPRDPIHYLGHWLFKYRYNEQVGEIRRIEVEQLTEAREKLAKEKWHLFVETEARAAVIDMIARAEEEAFENELLRIEKELADQEEENLEEEARDKFDVFGPI